MAGDDPAHRDWRECRRNARCDHTRCGHRDVAIRGPLSAGDRLVGSALQDPPTRNTSTSLRGSISRPRAICARPAPPAPSMRSNARWTSSRSRSSSIRSSFACGAIRIATRTMTGRTAARRCANATARVRRRSVGTSATPSRARCATAATSSAGAWRRASGRRCRCRSRCASCSPPNGHAEVACATSDIGTGTYTIMAQVAADMLGLPLDNISVKLGDFESAAIAGRGRIVDRGLGIERNRDDGRRDPRRAVASGKADAEFAARECRAPMRSRFQTASS